MPINNRNNQGTGFVNYQDILNANQDSGQRMGQAIGQGLQSQANAVKTGLGQQQQDFNTKLGQSQQDWSNVSDLASKLANLGSTNDYTGIAALNTPNTAENAVAFNGYGYKGPKTLSNVEGLQSQAASASNQGRLAGTSQGQQQLLGQYVGGGYNYTPGISTFDQSLLNRYGQNDLNTGKKALSNIGNETQNAINTAASKGQAAQNLITNQKQDYGQKIDTSFQNLQNTAQQQSTDYNNQGQQLKNILEGVDQYGVKRDFSTNPLTEQEIGLIGNMSQYGIDPSLSFDTRNKALADSVLNNIGNSFQAPTGALKYDPTQQTAANQLVNFLSGLGQADQTEVDSVKNASFDPNVFKYNPDTLTALNQLKGQDTSDIAAANKKVAYGSQLAEDAKQYYRSPDEGFWVEPSGWLSGAKIDNDPVLNQHLYGENFYSRPDLNTQVGNFYNAAQQEQKGLNTNINQNTMNILDYLNSKYGFKPQMKDPFGPKLR